MNRTIEQWRDFDCDDAAYNDPREFISELLQDAVSDLQELARQRDDAIAALHELMEWQVRNVDKWHNHAYDNAHKFLQSIKEQTK